MSFEHEVGYKPTCAGSPCKAKPALTHQGVVSRRPVGGALLVSDTGMVVVVCVFGGLGLHGSDLFQHVPQIVDQIGIWELWR